MMVSDHSFDIEVFDEDRIKLLNKPMRLREVEALT